MSAYRFGGKYTNWMTTPLSPICIFILQSAFNWSDPAHFPVCSRIRIHWQPIVCGTTSKEKDDKIIYTYNMERTGNMKSSCKKPSEAKDDVLYPRCVRAENLAPEEETIPARTSRTAHSTSHTKIPEIAKAINVKNWPI